jgi:hypothetical protein
MRMGASADVTQFTPAEVDGLIWIPRVDHFAKSLFEFTRGVQEAHRLRDFLKPETGVDLGSTEGIRRAGIDPEAGLVVFSKNGMLHLLFGVEDEDAVVDALQSKFKNLGFSQVVPDGNNPDVYRVADQSGATFAAFNVDKGLLVLVYRGLGTDPVGAAVAVRRRKDGAGFFVSERFKQAREKVGENGVMLYINGARLALNADGTPRLSWLDKIKLPPVIDAFARARISAWLSKVSFGAARITFSSCAALLRGTITANDGAELLPTEWLQPSDTVGPAFGKALPRDTVAMLRLSISVAPLVDIINQISRLGASMKQLGSILGLGGQGVDPIASMLGNQVHPQLADRHLVKDILDHLSGRLSIAVLGLDPDAQINDLMRIQSHPLRWLNAMQLVVALEVNNGPAFWDKWWPKREILRSLGFRVTAQPSGDRKVIQMTRGCGSKKKLCERYAVLLHDNMLMVMSGSESLVRVTEVLDGKASTYHGLTREKLARGVLEHEPMLLGGYFSFDGLLRALRNRNLPGGATRYLAQFYELAITFNTADGNAGAELLLTR